MTKTISLRRTYKYRLYRNKRDEHLHQAINVAGLIWNRALALSKRYYRRYGKALSFNRMQKHLAKLRAKTGKYAFWRELGSQAVQDVVQRLEKAFKRFFAKQGGFPRFKKVKQYRSFTLKQAGWKLLGGNKIRVLGREYKMILSRPIEGQIKTVTVKRDRLGRLWVCFSVTLNVEVAEASTGKIGGFDFGLKHFLTTDEGTRIESPQFFRQGIAEIRQLIKQLSHKKRGSHNRHKARLRLARAYERIANRRRDWFFKLAHRLCDEYSLLCFENLNMKAMQRMWGRKINDLGFSECLNIVESVAQKRGVEVVKIDRWTPTSKMCSGCGKRHDLSLKDRVLRCECGLEIDRDHNAAINIKRVGASTRDRGKVRPVTAGGPV